MLTNWLEFALFTFAAFRLTRLFVFDKITEFIRRPFHEEVEETESDGGVTTYIEIKGTGLRYWVGELLSCYWCTGVWCAAFLFGAYYLWPVGMEVIISILAIAGAAGVSETIISKIIN
jgi:hypothetical protein